MNSAKNINQISSVMIRTRGGGLNWIIKSNECSSKFQQERKITSDPPRSTHRRTNGGAVTTPNARNIDRSVKDWNQFSQFPILFTNLINRVKYWFIWVTHWFVMFNHGRFSSYLKKYCDFETAWLEYLDDLFSCSISLSCSELKCN